MALCKIFSIVFTFVAILSPSFGNPAQNCSGDACQRNGEEQEKTFPRKYRESYSKGQKHPDYGTKCGFSASAPHRGRIVGGDEAEPHSWPWQALIVCRNFLVTKHCGGSVISDKWVITAAHCVPKATFDSRRNCQVFLGKHNRKRSESTEQIAKIADYFIHEQYEPDECQNAYDVALYKLAKPIKFTDAIKPICLPFGLPELPYNKSCYATGWGRTKHNNRKLPERLMQLSMAVTEEHNCDYPVGEIICTVRWDRNKDVCNGDSGGPLACQEHDRRWYLRGVLSMASKKCDYGAIFTKVSSFENWIKTITSRN